MQTPKVEQKSPRSSFTEYCVLPANLDAEEQVTIDLVNEGWGARLSCIL